MANALEIEKRGDTYHIRGVLNEFAELDNIEDPPDDPIKLDVSDLVRINSIGVRNLLRTIQGWKGKSFVYVNAPADFIDQLNMVPALLGLGKNGSVESFQVPFECEDCGYESEDMVQTAAILTASGDLKDLSQSCPKCTSGSLDVIDETFFGFF